MPEPTPFFVTTPIYYPNDAPHIGHAYTSVAADTLARWRRLWGDDVMFLTGTDEHGTKIERAAEARGITPQEMVDGTSAQFQALTPLLDLTNTDFIRTTEPRHVRAVQEFLQVVYDNGDIELGTYEGLYCVACEAYYTEDELVGGNCPIHGRPVERVTEENWFFKLSRYEQRLLDHYAANPDAVQPTTRRNEVLGFIKQGLADFSMSRKSVSWGIPLPWDHEQTCYVWFDALFNYCTAAGYGTDAEKFARFWPPNYHLIAKDILRFHAVYWPAMLMAADLPLPAAGVRPRLSARRRREDVEDHAQPDRAAGARRRVRCRRLPLPLPARGALRCRRRHQLRGDGRAVQLRPRQQLRQPREPRAEHGDELLRRRRARRARQRPVGRRGRVRVRRAHRRHGEARLLERLRRGVGPHRRDQLVHRGPSAVGAQQGR